MLDAHLPAHALGLGAQRVDLAGVHERVFDTRLPQHRRHAIGCKALRNAIESQRHAMSFEVYLIISHDQVAPIHQ